MCTNFAQGDSFGMLPDTSVQCAPPSVVTFTRPSFDPTQSTPARIGDSASANNVAPSNVYRLSVVTPPELCWWVVSLRVRSGLITCQLAPPSVARLGPDAHVPRVIGPDVVDLEPAVVATRPHRAVVHGVGNRKAAFAAAHVTPLALAEPARETTARHAVGRAVLAIAVEVVGHARVGVHVVHLRDRKHDAGPGLTARERDTRATVVG